MRIYVRDSGAEPSDVDDGSSYSGLVRVPDAVLNRHGGRRLDPTTALLLEGQARPRPTVYRADRLLLPEEALDQPDRRALDEVLGEVQLRLDTDDAPPRRDGSHRVVALRRRPGPELSTVDAWVALQKLRAAAAPEDGRARAEVVERIGLDHLLVASAFGGVGRLHGQKNVATDGSGEDGDAGGFDPYAGPVPLSVLMPMPVSMPVSQPGAGGRAPVIALLDTGLGDHPWFTDDYLTVADTIQAAVGAAAPAGQPAISGPRDGPPTSEPLLGNLASHFGHGTFIAGLMRQLAPQARVKAVRIMHSDGVAYESDLLCALRAIAEETARARGGEAGATQVDVVSLSLGYFPEFDDTMGAALIAEFDRLTALGIVIVAAAGNFATSRPFLPAALATRYPGGTGAGALVSVGALNPNGSVALFSDEAAWVRCYAPGAAIVSTYPVCTVGTRQPDVSINHGHRQSLDRDDFAGGFAMWSGTSFATGAVAARIAAHLHAGSLADAALSLDRVDAATAVARAGAAVAAALAGVEGRP